MRPYGVVRLVLCEIQVNIDESSHEVCLASTHRQTEQVVGVGYPVEYLTQDILIVYLLGMMTDELLQFWGKLLAVPVFLTRILKECESSLVALKHLMGFYRKLLCTSICIIEIALCKQFVQRLSTTCYLQEQVCLDCLYLRITHHAPLLNILEHRTDSAIRRLQPQISFLLYK